MGTATGTAEQQYLSPLAKPDVPGFCTMAFALWLLSLPIYLASTLPLWVVIAFILALNILQIKPESGPCSLFLPNSTAFINNECGAGVSFSSPAISA
ncbi:MAG: hypothetical protein ACI9WS_001822 [Paraglaciecola psychrophila]|jgi:hypothetical protein